MKIDDVFKNNNVVCAHYFSNYLDRTGSDDESYLYLCRYFPAPLVQDVCRSDVLGKKKPAWRASFQKTSLSSCQMFRKVFSNIINAMRSDVFIEFETDRFSALI